MSSNPVDGKVYSMQHYIIKFFSNLPGTPVFFTNKTDRQDIAEIMLRVALNTISLAPNPLIWKNPSSAGVFYQQSLFCIIDLHAIVYLSIFFLNRNLIWGLDLNLIGIISDSPIFYCKYISCCGCTFPKFFKFYLLSFNSYKENHISIPHFNI